MILFNIISINLDYLYRKKDENTEEIKNKVRYIFNKYAPDMMFYRIDPKRTKKNMNGTDKESYRKIFNPVSKFDQYDLEFTLPFYHIFNKQDYEIARNIYSAPDSATEIKWNLPEVKTRFLEIADSNSLEESD